MLYVLRLVDREKNNYRFIDKCYAHGLMDGEILKGCSLKKHGWITYLFYRVSLIQFNSKSYCLEIISLPNRELKKLPVSLDTWEVSPQSFSVSIFPHVF